MKTRFSKSCAIATLIVSGLAGCGSGEDAKSTGQAVATPTPATEAAAPPGSGNQPAIPSIEISGDADQARMLTEINQAMADVTKEALSRPKDDRMTAEEIDSLIRSRIEEIKS